MLDRFINLLLYFGVCFIGAYGVWYSSTSEIALGLAFVSIVALLTSGKFITDKVMGNIFDLYTYIFTFIFLEKTITFQDYDLKWLSISLILTTSSCISYKYLSKSISSIVILFFAVSSSLIFGIKAMITYFDMPSVIVYGGLISFIACHVWEKKKSDKKNIEGMDFLYFLILGLVLAFPLESNILTSGKLFFYSGILFLLTAFIFLFHNIKYSTVLASVYAFVGTLKSIYGLMDLSLVNSILILGIVLISLSLLLRELKKHPQLLQSMTNRIPKSILGLRLPDEYIGHLERFVLEHKSKKKITE